MTTRRIVLLSSVILLAILPFVASYYRGKVTREIIPKYPEYIPITEVLPVHEGRIKDRVDLLKKQTLEETFVYLLDDQQYFYPGFHSEAKLVPQEIETMLSTRSTLKVFQQFDALPREQAIQKLKVFCTGAIKDFDEALKIALWRNANPTQDAPSTISITGAKYMLCVSMLLAARAGEYKLLLNQFNEMQHIVDGYVEEMRVYIPPEREYLSRGIVSLEDDCVLTILMHALKRAGKNTDAPLVGNFITKTIPLYQWDAALIYYDFEVVRQLKTPNPKDIVEQFDVYAFSGEDRFDIRRKKIIINSMKEMLSK